MSRIHRQSLPDIVSSRTLKISTLHYLYPISMIQAYCVYVGDMEPSWGMYEQYESKTLGLSLTPYVLVTLKNTHNDGTRLIPLFLRAGDI